MFSVALHPALFKATKHIKVDRMRSAVTLPVCYIMNTGLDYIARYGRSQSVCN